MCTISNGMKVLFIKDVARVARKGDIKEMADGYAMNFLLPQGIAVQATAAKIAEHAKQTAQNKEAEEKHLAEVKKKLQALEGKRITIKVRANEKGHLFKSINAREVLAAIEKESGEAFAEQSLKGNELPLRGVGEHPIHIETAGAKASLTFVIEAA